jgi:hypothetical protein
VNKKVSKERRNHRLKAVLPVRIFGSDATGKSYNELAHTLDIAENGARLGAIRCGLEVGSVLVLQYRQNRAEFRVVWTKQLQRCKEHHVGLVAISPKDVWGLVAEFKAKPQEGPVVAHAVPAAAPSITA